MAIEKILKILFCYIMISEQQNEYVERCRALKCCVIIPTYNNAGTLDGVINDVEKYCDNVIVVNDGSTDSTLQILNKYPHLSLISYTQNVGKGYALRRGFKHALQRGFEYAITIDSDGQHNACDIPSFIKVAEGEAGFLIVGARNMDQVSVPGKSSFGHKFSNFWFWFETGVNLPDTQSGFRLYPLLRLKNIKWVTRKYEFEIEVIVRAAWEGIKITSVPVSVYYAPKEKRISHFRPFVDFSRVSLLNVVLVAMSVVYYIPRRYLGTFKKKSLRDFIKSNFLNPHESERKKISSIMFGVFMGIFPIWGYQLLVGIPLAHFFKLNKSLFFLAANISIPPMIPFILFGSFQLGGLLLGSADSTSFQHSFSWRDIGKNTWQYIIGAVALAIIASAFSGLLLYVYFRLFPLKSKSNQHFQF